MTFDTLLAGPVMAVLRGLPPEETVRIARTAWQLGVAAVEVPIGRPEQVPALAAAVAAGRAEGRGVGAGTVLTVEQVAAARVAGAVFTVSPGFDPDVLRASLAADMPHLPGVATPTELHRAVAAGCGWVKVFPASALGPSWFRDIRGPFPDVRLVATGGITAATAADFLRAGADVVGVGSALSDPTQLPSLVALLRT